MKKLKKFQKFALSTEQASKVKGGFLALTCHYDDGSTASYPDATTALEHCGSNCAGCF